MLFLFVAVLTGAGKLDKLLFNLGLCFGSLVQIVRTAITTV